jgi:hypothetical protein
MTYPRSPRLRPPLRAIPAVGLAALLACGGGSSGSGTSGETPNGSAQPYAAGASVAGDLAANTALGPNDSVGRLFTLTLAQQTNLLFTLTASGFPPFLGLYTASGQPIVERPTSNTWFKVFLPAGAYQVFVDSMNDLNGSFTLTSAATLPGGCSVVGGDMTPLETLHTVQGAILAATITSSDCGGSLSKTHVYELPLTAGTQLNVSFTVDKMSGVAIRNGSGAVLASKEMAGAGSGTLTATAAASGYYGVHIESRTANGVSSLPVAYTLSIQ